MSRSSILTRQFSSVQTTWPKFIAPSKLPRLNRFPKTTIKVELKDAIKEDDVRNQNLGVVAFDIIPFIPQGSDNSERTGQSIRIKALSIRMWVVNRAKHYDSFDLFGEKGLSNDVYVRWIIALDHQTNKTANGSNALRRLLTLTPLGVLEEPTLQSHYRFDMLADKQFIAKQGRVVNVDWFETGSKSDGTTGTWNLIKPLYWNNLDIPISFDGTGGTITAMTTNSLRLWFILHQDGNLGAELDCHYSCQVWYTDDTEEKN